MKTPASPFLTILLLWGAGLGAAAQFGKIAVVFDRFGQIYPQAGQVQLGLIVSAVGFVGLILGTTAGIFAQRLGYRRVLVAALATGALLSGVEALFPPLPVFLLLRGLEGFSHLAIVVAGPVLIARIAPLRHQGLAMTLWSSFFGVSFALTAALGLPLVQAWGDAALLLAHAVYMAVFAVLLWMILPSDTPPEPTARQSLLRQHAQIYRSPSVSAPALGFFCYTLTYVALMTLLPPMFGAHQALIASSFPLISIAVSLTLGVQALRYFPAFRLAQAGFAGAVVSCLVLWLFWGGSAALLGAWGIAACLGIAQGASFAAVPQLNPDPADQSRAAGAIAQLGNLGTTTGTPLLAWLILGQGVTGVMLFVLLPSFLGLFLHQWLALRRQRIR